MNLETLIRDSSRASDPLPTGVEPQLQPLGVRAVLFDIYGTLLISAAGEIGTADGHDRAGGLVDALQAMGISTGHAGKASGDELLSAFEATIREHQRDARRRGVDVPEIDIRIVWRDCLDGLVRGGRLPVAVRDVDLERLAVEFELRVNPVWPMPGAAQCLQELRRRGVTLGIISNAQFFTPLLFPALLDGTTEALGFDTDLIVYSYECGRAKPDAGLHARLARALQRRGVPPGEVLYVGNDRRNDVLPAIHAGFRAALFSGDARSYRPREDDPELRGVEPDVVLTDLMQILDCVAEPDRGDRPTTESAP